MDPVIEYINIVFGMMVVLTGILLLLARPWKRRQRGPDQPSDKK